MNTTQQKRYYILKNIYDRTGFGDSSNAISRNDIYEATVAAHNQDWKDFLDILGYLQEKNLIDFVYDEGLQPYFRITSQGIDEVEAAINKPEEPTAHFTSEVFNTQFYGTVGAVQQSGKNNVSNVVQNIGGDGFYLDDEALKKLQMLVDNLINNQHEDLPQSQAYQSVAILSELKEAGEKKDKSGQLQAITKWRKWWNSLPPKAQAVLSLAADAVSLGLPLAKCLLTGSPF
ncbi:MAG: hypothetical protein AB1589_11810 [Cyanobacteriota bacterium]